ncbi:CRAL-TRIO domain protein [Kalmanozyma brasiliensis GHG001]|uniref:CRAL-TRIO domain-containing protein n=1 Tax=Kalmanozyma brasiliensis (strain GHG001) TaxID=1365824 RepID=V5EUN5_KALBG|nr:CRAL-TRIO domain protein [Kalmanozyma brasiliensis GHG001]EST06893.1 CRAL-TRIO domain protein [Kalmanozyma brasiliensis GHG001]
MPSVQELKSKNARAVQEKHLDLVGKYKTHYPAVEKLHKLAKEQIVDDVASQLDLNEEGKARVLLYLSDFANLFRFYRRSRYDHDQAINLLNATLLWRMRTDLDLLSLSSLNPLYVTPPPPNPPLFWVNSHFRDFYGRPCGIINLRSVERTAEGTLDQIKEYIVACMEMMRRYVADLYRASTDGQQGDSQEGMILQASIAIDLASSGMANLELELLPFLLDLLKNHVPGMVGAVYILNYGWVHAGMWAVIKRVLPQQALAKIFFPSYEELKEHFDAKAIPACYGGELDVAVESSTNDVLRKYGRPRRASNATPAASASTPPHSPGVSRHISRNNSYDSIYEVFYSADSTPWASRPITPRHSEPSTPRGNGSDVNAAAGLKMTPSAARKLKHLQMSRGDLSSAAESAHLGGRSRSGSEPKIVDGRAVGLSVSVGASPYATPSITPVGPLSPRVTRARNPDRHVRFSSDRSESPPRRVGATSNFTLYLPEEDEEAILPSESEDSDASGKDGELPPTPAPSGLLNRLRRLSDFTSSGNPPKPVSDTPTADGTIMYIEPSSPRLQVELFDEPPLQHVPHTFLSHRTRRSKRDGLVSPYNANNPFFGYPAIQPTAQEATFRLNRSATPQHLHSRRRKRDLLRTLTYLFVLRILAFHRRLRWRMSLVWREAARTLSVGPRAAGAGEGEDDFWRNLDMSRLSAVQEDERRAREKMNKSQGPVGKMVKKLMGAVVLLMLLRPEWRQRAMVQVYATFGSMLGRRDAGNEVNWDEWDQSGVAANSTAKQNRSWTGMHLRRRIGLKANVDTKGVPPVTTAAAPGKSGKNSRAVNPLAVAGGLISAASLAYLLYTYLTPSSDPNKDDDDDVASRRTSLKPTPSNRVRPSLSLCLSPPFARSPENIAGLRTLLHAICPVFVVHLIVPGSPDDELSASIASLSATLGPIRDFDARRVLEYTQPAGRFALSRALACDCHVEVALPTSEESGTVTELMKVKRSCGLVVFASFEGGEGGGRAVLAELRRVAEEAGAPGKDAPNGMRAFDLGASAEAERWRVLGVKLGELREGWK